MNAPVNHSAILEAHDRRAALAKSDPLLALAYWIEAGDPAPVQLMRRQPSHAPGMLSRREFVDYYAERSGIKIDNFDFYYTYGLFRLAGIVQQIYYRFFHGQTQDKHANDGKREQRAASPLAKEKMPGAGDQPSGDQREVDESALRVGRHSGTARRGNSVGRCGHSF